MRILISLLPKIFDRSLPMLMTKIFRLLLKKTPHSNRSHLYCFTRSQNLAIWQICLFREKLTKIFLKSSEFFLTTCMYTAIAVLDDEKIAFLSLSGKHHIQLLFHNIYYVTHRRLYGCGDLDIYRCVTSRALPRSGNINEIYSKIAKFTKTQSIARCSEIKVFYTATISHRGKATPEFAKHIYTHMHKCTGT